MLSAIEQFTAVIILFGAFGFAALALAVVEAVDRRKERIRAKRRQDVMEQAAHEAALTERRRRTEVIRFAERFNAGEGA